MINMHKIVQYTSTNSVWHMFYFQERQRAQIRHLKPFLFYFFYKRIFITSENILRNLSICKSNDLLWRADLKVEKLSTKPRNANWD